MPQVIQDGDLVRVIIPREAHDYPPEYTYVILHRNLTPGVMRTRHVQPGTQGGKPIIIKAARYQHRLDTHIFLENPEAMLAEARQWLEIHPDWLQE